MPSFLDEQQTEIHLIDGHILPLGYDYAFGPQIAPDGERPERKDYSQVVLEQRLQNALARINPDFPKDVLAEAARKLTRTRSPSLIESNRSFHRMLTEGIAIEHHDNFGRRMHKQVWPVDFNNPANNEFLVVNQFTVIENNRNRRADVVLFVNGLPLVVIEIKNPTDSTADIRKAFQQLQTYKRDISGLFVFNELLIITDGLEARAGSLTAEWERFSPWRSIDGEHIELGSVPQMQVLAAGMLHPERLLDLIRYFSVFEDDGHKLEKKTASYHQYFAVNKAIACTVNASTEKGDKRIGVIWHTQGSGKSLSMAFYAGKIIQQSPMQNPTLVVLTDRNDLDNQLFGTFSRCRELLRQAPEQAKERNDLRKLLMVASGGVVFTTIQKFLPAEKGELHPLLSDRRNIVVIADEAHRSQYGFTQGFARRVREALPNASFIGFTGTPIEKSDRNTRSVFGDYIDIYDIQRSLEDGATVRIYYEGRMAKIDLSEDQRPRIDPDFDEVTEDQEQSAKQAAKSRWARLEALVGTENRIKLVARDLVNHWENRLSGMDGKAMIVCMSRRICVELYKELIKLRPHWHDSDDTRGVLKIVMTGSASDPEDWQEHIRSKPRREQLAARFKKPEDEFKIVIVRDMWLTGFDVPCLHTMYVDKPMKDHTLMQAIARVNRVFADKPGGLVVDYLGLADELKSALAIYTEEGGKGRPTLNMAEAVAVMLEKFTVVTKILGKFDYAASVRGPVAGRMGAIARAMDYVLSLPDGKKKFLQAVAELSKAFALALPSDESLRIRDDVAFFQAVRAGLVKSLGDATSTDRENIDEAVRQIVSRSVISDKVIDVFAAAGLEKPEISILSEKFLAEVRQLPQKNLAVEMLRKLLNDQIRTVRQKNLIESGRFSVMLEEAIRKYQNRSIEAAQVIEQLIAIAKEMREANKRGEELGLSTEELAFYDALEVNDSAVKVLGEPTLKKIARELFVAIKNNTRIDWTVRESVKAEIRLAVKRILKKYGYPPDKQQTATETVLKQAELVCANIAA
ncbi:MAG TPA: type I restriction endonuclease subunit R [Phycisphaerae bacterium]|nr:type I restriction endonuclease subunit R [Phycisphaerae bacterium]